MLTLQQVHENNVVAKKWLVEISTEIKRLEKERESRKSYNWKQKFLDVFLNAEQYTDELFCLGVLKEAQMHLEIYFKFHYVHAALLSKTESPKFTFTQTTDRVLYQVERTYKCGKVPHEI